MITCLASNLNDIGQSKILDRSHRSVIIFRTGHDTEIDTSCTLSSRKNILAAKTFLSFRLTLIVSSTPSQPSTCQKSLSLADVQKSSIFGARFQQCESCLKVHPLLPHPHPPLNHFFQLLRRSVTSTTGMARASSTSSSSETSCTPWATTPPRR